MTQTRFEGGILAPLQTLPEWKRINPYTYEVHGRHARLAAIVARPDDPLPTRFMVNVFRPGQQNGQIIRKLESHGNFRTLAGVVAYLADQDLISAKDYETWKIAQA